MDLRGNLLAVIRSSGPKILEKVKKKKIINQDNLKRKASRIKRALSSSTLTCKICLESKFKNEFFKNTGDCAHRFCSECIASYIKTCVEDNVAAVKCPSLRCNNFLDPLSCKEIVSETVFTQWCDLPGGKSFCFKEEVEGVEDELFMKLVEEMRWIRCPNCRYIVERFGGCLTVWCRCGVCFCYGCGGRRDGGCRGCLCYYRR